MKPAWWDEARTQLARRDKVLRKLVKQYPDASLRTRGDAFQTLARSIVGQQISVRAAQAVWDRFEAHVGRVQPARVAAHDDDALKSVGLSRMKVAYLKDLAARFHDGSIKPRRWTRMDDEAVIADLVQVKGIGRWSVEMFLIFHLMRPDVLPVGDLGLQRAMEKLYNGGRELTKDEMREIGAPWRPYASAATWYLWRSLDPIPVEY